MGKNKWNTSPLMGWVKISGSTPPGDLYVGGEGYDQHLRGLLDQLIERLHGSHIRVASLVFDGHKTITLRFLQLEPLEVKDGDVMYYQGFVAGWLDNQGYEVI